MLKITPFRFVLLLMLIVGGLLFVRHSGDFKKGAKVPGDFSVYHLAGLRVQKGETPYLSDESSPFKYAPSALVFFQCLPKNANYAWIFFKLLCLILLITPVLMSLSFPTWRDVLFLGLGFLMSWKGIIETLNYGQLEFFAWFGFIFASISSKKFPFFSGVVVGFLPWLKLPWGFLALPFVLQAIFCRRWHLLGGLGVGFVGGATLPFLVFGFSAALRLNQEWFQVLKDQPEGLYLGEMNQSIWSTAARWETFSSAGSVVILALLVGICAWTLAHLVMRVKNQSSEQHPLGEASLWLILMQLINPLSWRWGSMLLIGAPWAIADAFRLSKRRGTFILLGVVMSLMLLIQHHFFSSFLEQMGIFHHQFYGSVTFYWGLVLVLSSFYRFPNQPMKGLKKKPPL